MAAFCFLLMMLPSVFAEALSSYKIDEGRLSEAARLLSKNKFEQALSFAGRDKYLRKAIKFLYYSDPNSDASFEEIISFVNQNPNYPDRDSLRLIAENKINNSIDKAKLIAWCGTSVPTTSAHFCLAHLSENKFKPQIAKLAKLAWATTDYTKRDELEFLEKYGSFLSEKDHIKRVDYLLANKKKLSTVALDQLDPRHKQLAQVKLRLILHHNRLDTNSSILEDVAAHLRHDPHLLYWEALWYSKHGDVQKLKKLLLSAQKVQETKTNKWFKIRSLLVWDLCDLKDYRAAYTIAASHQYTDPVNYVDGEWLAGKVAYNYLKDPKLALVHFENILNKAQYSPSIARGAYWSGVALQDLRKPEEAAEYFKTAGQYVDTFYGQLALMKLNHNKKFQFELASIPHVTAADEQWFRNNELLIIGHILAHMHKINTARKFIQAAFNSADTDGKKYLIGTLGQHVGNLTLSMISGKEAARRGVLCIKHAYPILRLELNNVKVEPALVLAIIRQESEFNSKAKSCAGASGLMQLMYATAKEVGYRIKHPVSSNRLMNSKDNIKLGSSYVQQLLDQYDGSYVLAIAAYNAGPGPVNKWIEKYGDPRKFKTISQVVTWIENIPFSETRAYVQNVLSNLQLYRSLMTHKTSNEVQKISLNMRADLISGG
jgi:soluble lytic murein transglycosylase